MQEKLYCPFCGGVMLAHHSMMWTGMNNQILMYKFECIQQDHTFQVRAATEEKLMEIINGRRNAKKINEDSKRSS